MAEIASIDWGGGNLPGVISPSAGKISTGWIPGEKPPAQYFNYLERQGWLAYNYVNARVKNAEPVIIRSSGSITWSGTQISFASNLQIIFRKAIGAQINQIQSGASPISLADGEVLVVKRDYAGGSPVNLASGTYGTLVDGEYAIVTETSLTGTDIENEMILFRRRGSDLEVPYLGQIIPTGTTFTIGQGGAVGAHTHDAADIVSGTFADARIAVTNVTQHQAALALAASQITSGVFSDARIAQSNVTQHQAALSLAASQITSGTLPVIRGGTGTTTSTGSGSVVLSNGPVFTAVVNFSNGLQIANNEGLFFGDLTSYFTLNTANDILFLYLGGAQAATFAYNDSFFFAGDIAASPDNTFSCGRNAQRFTEVWAVDGSINTSDAREKQNVLPCDLGLDFILALNPVSFEWIKREDGKRHYGLIAQQVRDVLGVEKNFAGLYDTMELADPEDERGLTEETRRSFGLSYTQLIAPMIKAIQELEGRVQALEA